MSNTGHSLSVNVLLYHGDSLIKGVGYLEVELQNKFIYTDAACTIRSKAATERFGDGYSTLFTSGGRLSHQQAGTPDPHDPRSSRELMTLL